MSDAIAIKEALYKAGAAAVGVAAADPLRDVEKLINERMERGRLARMRWLGRTARKRTHPSELLKNAASIICSAWPYSREKKYPHFARYSLSEDYHDFIRERLRRAWKGVAPESYAIFSVDSEPVAEKAYSELAGLGWIGKNSLLINRDIGSFFCLGLIVTDLELETDEPHKNLCGDCKRCIEACPTGAIVAPGEIDCRRCVSYLTIEEKAEIPEGLRSGVGANVFGCDICQEACPYNGAGRVNSTIPGRDIDLERLGDLMSMSEAEFNENFKGTPIVRLGRPRFLRNVAVALGNMEDEKALGFLSHGLHDRDSLIREHCKWAIEKITNHKGDGL